MRKMHGQTTLIYSNSSSANVTYRMLSNNFHLPFTRHFLSKPLQITLYKPTERRHSCAGRTVQFYILWGHLYGVSNMATGIAQSVWQLAIGWMSRASNLGTEATLSVLVQNSPETHPSFYTSTGS